MRTNYISKDETEKPGYLKARMEIYKEMVRNESKGRIHPVAQAGHNPRADEQIYDKQKYGLQGSKPAPSKGEDSQGDS